MLGLPDGITACLFDLDGVLTDTAAVHDAAWTADVRRVPADRAERLGGGFVPFDPAPDYNRVRRRPAARRRRAHLPRLAAASPCPRAARTTRPTRRRCTGSATARTRCCCGPSTGTGCEVYAGSVAYLHAARDAGLRRAVVSASANTRQVLDVAGLADLVEVRVDGVTVRAEHLRGKPAPDTFLAAAGAARRRAGPGAPCSRTPWPGSRPAGPAGSASWSAWTGSGHADALREHGADVVVRTWPSCWRRCSADGPQ